jgi:hypothetical protein
MSAYEAALRAQLISLRARELALRKFVLNREAQFEANILVDQITALSVEVKRVMS